MPIALDRGDGYQAALHDLTEAMKLAAYAQRSGILCHFGQLVQSELTHRWQMRIRSGDLPPCYAPHQAMAVGEAAAALFSKPAEVR